MRPSTASLRSLFGAVGVLALVVVLIAGCGSSKSPSSSTVTTTSARAAGADPAVEAMVPAAIKAMGTITVASDASYPPFESIGPNGHTVIGADADLVHALARVMGIKANVVNVSFDAIIPGLAAGKYQMAASGLGDTLAREKVVNFVDYGRYLESLFTKSSGGTVVSGMAGLCGKTLAIEAATTELMDAQAQSKKCTAEGKPSVHIVVVPTQTAANLAVISRRVQLGFADSPVASYEVLETHGQLKVVGSGPVASSGPYGFAFPKSSGLDKAALAALLVLNKNGTYESIFKKWGMVTTEIPTSEIRINGARSFKISLMR